MIKKILIIGPFPNPVHGCSLANEILSRGLAKKSTPYQTIDMSTDFSEEIGSFSFKKALHAFKQYLSIFKVFRSDVVYLTPGQSFFGVLKYAPFILLARLLRKQIIFHVHGNHLWKEFELTRKFKQRIMRFLIRSSTKGIVLSPSLKKNLNHFLLDEKIYPVYNFAEDFLHNPTLVKDFDNLRIIYLSNLMTEKGILDLLEALEILKTQGVIFKAHLAGAIALETKSLILDKISKLGDSAEYLGTVHGEQKKQLLDWGNTFVFPTFYHSEGQPIALIEAMATGNTIITTKHAGIPDLLTEENAFFVSKKSPNQIAEVLASFYSNNQDFKSKSEFNLKNSKRYTEEAYVNNILEVIDAK
jgi:glycosyltransferase involved in cell wall biosynthesis